MAEGKDSKPDLDSMTTEERVKYHYEHGQGSIQDIARVYRLNVDEVLHIIGQDEMTTVSTTGDMIDQSEAGPGVELNYNGKQHFIPYTTD